ncbi:MAG: hypothetical protein HYZ71_10540 [Deltaproteobacteria bacterium]|nr:hypothetical protein [Deltaproteobacteria bacterium]
MSTLFSFDADSSLEKQIRSEAREELKHFLKKEPDPDAAFRGIFNRRPKTIRWSNYLRLKILHRQFSKGTVPGLPVIVRSARFLYGRYRNLKRMIPDNS